MKLRKKIMGVSLVILLVITAILAAACDFIPDLPGNRKKEVKLIGVSSSLELKKEAKVVMASTALFADAGESGGEVVEPPTTGGETGTPGTNEGETGEPTPKEDDPEFYSTYTIIYKTQTMLYFTINLSNPKNYYILDFRLTCAEEDVTVKQGNHYSNINNENTYIRWDEAVDRIGNHTATFELHLPNANITPDNIKISEMYYSDRTDGTNKTSVNMNNKETYTVYKIDEPVVMTDRKNNFEEFSFKLAAIEGAVIKSVKVDGVAFDADAAGVYHIPGGELVIEYEYTVTDGVKYEKKIEEKIELLVAHGIRRQPIDITSRTLNIGGYFTGTDSEKVSIKGYSNITISFDGDSYNILPIDGLSEDWCRVNYFVVAGTEFNIWDLEELLKIE